jgi:hypothetical protein
MTATAPDRKSLAADATGLAAGKIGIFRLQLAQLRQLGILVDVDACGLSKFTRAASYAEWGIADRDERHGRLRGGQKLLIPEVQFKRGKSIETRARNLLDRYGHGRNTEGIAPWTLILYTAYPKFSEDWKRLEDEWADWKRDVIRNLDLYRTQLAAEFAVIADRAWRSIAAQKFLSEERQINGRTFKTKREFVEFIVSEATSRLPTEADIRRDVVLDYRTAIVEDEGDVAARTLAIERMEAQRAKVESKIQKAERAESVADAKARAQIAAMREAELEHARKRIAETVQPIDLIVNDMRARLLEIINGMKTSVEKNGFVRGKVAAQAEGLLEWYQMMSIGDEREIAEKIKTLQASIGAVGKKRTDKDPERDVAKIKQALDEITALAEQEAKNVTISGRFRALEL